MSPIRSNVRPALSRAARFATFAALSAVLLGASGCHWFHKKNIYATEGDQRPLELPPTFDQAAADRAAEQTGPVTRSSMAGDPAVRASSFSVSGDRAAVFAKVGEALANVQGATVANRAQLLGAYDIDYAGETFLVRITEAFIFALFVEVFFAVGLGRTGTPAGATRVELTDPTAATPAPTM